MLRCRIARTRGRLTFSGPTAVNFGQRRTGPLRAFLDWWLDELRSMVPPALSQALGLSAEAVVIRCEPDEIVVTRGERGISIVRDALTPERLGQAIEAVWTGAPADFPPVRLAIGRALTLERTLSVPKAAAADLGGLLSFEIERHTPYRAAEVVFAWAVRDDGESAAAALRVDVLVLPRETAGTLLASVRETGLEPEAIEIASPDGATLAFPAETFDLKPKPVDRRVLGWATAAATLALLVVATPFLHQQISLSHLRGLSTASRAQLDASVGAATGQQAAAQAIVDAKLKALPATRIVDTLSQVLPDGTWLRHVAIADGEILIEGSTERSAPLVDLLEKAPFIDGVRYTAPVTREPNSNLERFGFSFTWSRGQP
jgi:general secretion pathway protein L